MSPETSMLVQSFATLVALLALLWGVAWLAPKLRARRDAGPMQVLGRCTLDAGRAVYVVRVGDEALVIGASDSSIALLSKTSLATFAPPSPPSPIAETS
ncbi:MAG: flagellar biosynthetic protein FliO [Polyangiales bacterium]